MGASWTNTEQEKFLETYEGRFQQLKANLPARKNLVLEVYQEFVKRWAPETWGFNNMAQFEGTEEQILAQKLKKMHERIRKWFYDKDALRAKRKPEAYLLPLSRTRTSESGRKRMAKPLNKYYDLYIATNPLRANELNEKFEEYRKEYGKDAKQKMNWRNGVLGEWYAEESQEVHDRVESERKKEMGIEEEDVVEDGGNDAPGDTVRGTGEMEVVNRLERAKVQQE